MDEPLVRKKAPPKAAVCRKGDTAKLVAAVKVDDACDDLCKASITQGKRSRPRDCLCSRGTIDRALQQGGGDAKAEQTERGGVADLKLCRGWKHVCGNARLSDALQKVGTVRDHRTHVTIIGRGQSQRSRTL